MVERNSRPDPDQLLAHIQAEEQASHRGRLKIFLGYAAGVGKTYAMLEAAHQRRREGVDVVIGYVETHGRVETESLALGLEMLPRKPIEYRGVQLTEMDLDALLARRPGLALVDELAHTNAPGSRHAKRFQDVEELLAAGIDVYTTLNIQHLESLNDVVAQITSVQVRETIPDRVIDQADDLELVDLPPDELLNRLREGKVYLPDQAARAIQKFFRKGNLTALREMSLRRAAERVDDQMRAYMQTSAIPGPWHAAERLIVCVSPSSLGERLVRSTRRLADELNAEWLAVYVETPDHLRYPEEQRDQVFQTLLLAEELGARAITLPQSVTAPSVSGTVLEYARRHNITKIVAGKPLRPLWQEMLHGSIVDQLIRHSGNIDVYVISSVMEGRQPTEELALQPHHPWRRYLWSLLIVAGATGLSSLVSRDISPTNLVMIYLLTVVVSAFFWGRGPAVLSALVSVLAFDYFFVPPFFTFSVADTEYLLTFAGLLVVGLVISYLTVLAREQAVEALSREAETAALYALSRDLSVAEGLEAITQAILNNVSLTFSREVAVFLPKSDAPERLELHGHSSEFSADEKERAVVMWSYQHGQPAGRGTQTLVAAQGRYLPMRTARGVVGVLGIKPKDPSHRLDPAQSRLLEAFASQAALAVERVLLAEQARHAELLQATEKLQAALLNSISHDLRTPLVSITGALTSLQDGGIVLDDEIRGSLIETARQEADRLNRLVGNLLSMTRLEGGAMKVASEPEDVQDAIGAALEQLNDRLGDHPVEIDVPEDFPLVAMDFALIVQVLVNLVDNAVKYSPAGAPIEIQAQLEGDWAYVIVADRGVGIPEEDLARIFDKFYRVQRPGSVTGTGLGLAICKGIVEAHGGRITAVNRTGGGAMITLALPIEAIEVERAR